MQRTGFSLLNQGEQVCLDLPPVDTSHFSNGTQRKPQNSKGLQKLPTGTKEKKN